MMRLALGEEKLIAFSYRVVILYFQYNLGRMLEEIWCNGFFSINKSLSRGICET